MTSYSERREIKDKIREKRNKYAIAFLIVGITFATLSIGLAFYVGYIIEKDTTSYLHRIDGSGDANTSLQYLDKAIAGYEKHGLTKGYTSYLFKTPSSDLSYKYNNLLSIRSRLYELTLYPNRTSEEYVQTHKEIKSQVQSIRSEGGLVIAWDRNHNNVILNMGAITFACMWIVLLIKISTFHISDKKIEWYKSKFFENTSEE